MWSTAWVWFSNFLHESYHESSNFAECRYFTKFKWPYFSSPWCYCHVVDRAGSPTHTVYVGVTLTRSNIKVNVTELLNFRQLAKPCMLAVITAGPLRGFLVRKMLLMIMHSYWPLGKQIKQLMFQRNLCRTLCSCLVVIYEDHSSSIGRFSASDKFFHRHVCRKRRPLKVREYQHAHEIPHGLYCAPMFFSNVVDLYIHTTLDMP